MPLYHSSSGSGGSGSVATDTIWDSDSDLAVGSGADTAAVLPVAASRIVARLAAGSLKAATAAEIKTLLAIVAADISDFNTAVATTAVLKTLFDANTVLAATADDTPAPITMGASTILARLAAGNIKAATPAELKTLLAISSTDVSNFTTAAKNASTRTFARANF